MTPEEWAEIDKKLTSWLEWRSRKLNLPKVTCGDCRQEIKPWEVRETFGDVSYHADRCGPMAGRTDR
jgi:hypothetical protein